MPVRLYYDVFDQKALVNQLKQLKCVFFESEDRFILTYDKEARKIPLSTPYNKVPKEVYPVILAHGQIVDEKHLHLNLRSFERGIGMVVFIDQWIDQSVAKATHAASYNEVSKVNKDTVQSLMNLDFDDLFSEKNMTILDPKEKMQMLKASVEVEQDEEEKLKVIAHF